MYFYTSIFIQEHSAAETGPLCNGTELSLGDRVLGEVEKNSFIAGHQERSSGQLVLKRPELPEGFQGKVYKDRVRKGVCGVCDQLVDLLLIDWW